MTIPCIYLLVGRTLPVTDRAESSFASCFFFFLQTSGAWLIQGTRRTGGPCLGDLPNELFGTIGSNRSSDTNYLSSPIIDQILHCEESHDRSGKANAVL